MNIIRLDAVDSTNDYLKREKNLLTNNFLSVRADIQTAGKGRNSRDWISVPGLDLTFSVVYNTGVNPQAASIYAGAAVLRVLKKYISSDDLKIKWPNDIYFGDSKLCGILCEMVKHDDGFCVIIGIGINVNSEHAGSDKGYISVFDIISEETCLDLLHREILLSLREIFTDFSYPVPDKILNEWRDNNCSIGCEVIYICNDIESKGTVTGINSDCSISVLDSDGIRTTECFDNVIFFEKKAQKAV
ncbi:MAG: biotin--[acetyl-CoA-carboxylase] ligase [Spirochaetes bacterium]|nr:biotin--[acetyl-CoA-carboxylase] ligase [Spirochaetota bacterium]